MIWSPTQEKPKANGHAGPRRCIKELSWAHVAEQTLDIYRKVVHNQNYLPDGRFSW